MVFLCNILFIPMFLFFHVFLESFLAFATFATIFCMEFDGLVLCFVNFEWVRMVVCRLCHLCFVMVPFSGFLRGFYSWPYLKRIFLGDSWANPRLFTIYRKEADLGAVIFLFGVV